MAIAALAVAAQITAMRTSSRRLLDELQRGLDGYRLVLLAPAMPTPAVRPPAPKPIRPVVPRPLATPDPRILESLDSRVQGFIRENPAVESIVTRELVRDFDNGVLDLPRLLEKSSLEIAFDLDRAGNVRRPRIRKSCGVPSIDHLGLETARLLDKYQLLTAFHGASRIYLSLRVGDTIVVKIEGVAGSDTRPDDIRSRVQSTLALLRFALAKSSAAFMLQDIVLEAKDARISLTRVFDKTALIGYLTNLSQDETVK